LLGVIYTEYCSVYTTKLRLCEPVFKIEMKREKQLAISSEILKEEEKTTPARKPVVPAVEQACQILLCLGETQREMRLSEICKYLPMHRSRIHAILHALLQFGFVEKNLQKKTYSPGPALFSLGRTYLDQLSYPAIVEPFLEGLAREANATAVFGFIIGDHVLAVAKHEGNQNIGITLRVGHRVPIALGAHGKAILASMPEEERRKILRDNSLFFKGNIVRLNKKHLEKELARCRELGFAKDTGEVTEGVNVVSAPIFGERERLIGCLILFGTFPAKIIDTFGKKVAEAARQISYKVGADLKRL